MPLGPVFGHEGVRNRLAGARASGRLPQALLLEGPRGVGKQRLALWLAQLLLCEHPGESDPCGTCPQCRMALALTHPDLHWFVPLELGRKASDPDKQIEVVEAALAETMEQRRTQAVTAPPGGMATHGIASVRLLLRRLSVTPALARCKVFVIGEADRLVPQEANPEAANALLKALEEPPANTVFVLTAVSGDALLPTIRSRVVRVRVARLPDTVVTIFAQRVLGLSGAELAQRVRDADGAIGALSAASRSSEHAVTRALLAGGVTALAMALGQRPFEARGAFTELLDDLLGRLRADARAGRGDPRGAVAAIDHVLHARELARGNVNPQLLSAVLSHELRGVA